MLVAEIGAGFLVAWTPERYWNRTALILTPPDILRYYRPLSPGGRRSFRRALGRARDTWVERLPSLRTYRPGGWNPTISNAWKCLNPTKIWPSD